MSGANSGIIIQQLPAVTELTDDESSGDDGPEPRRTVKKRKKQGPSLRERLLSQSACRELVQKRCVGQCKRNCLKHFAGRRMFAQLLDFRKQISEMHKIDVDRFAAFLTLQSAVYFVGQTLSVHCPLCDY